MTEEEEEEKVIGRGLGYYHSWSQVTDNILSYLEIICEIVTNRVTSMSP